MQYEFPEALLIQFAKAPLKGQVKTRMQPALSERQSLALHCQLVRGTHQAIHSAALCQSQLWVAGKGGDDFFLSLEPSPEVKYQQGGDLGERMHLAIAAGLQQWQMVVLIGSDCPGIDSAYLRRALCALKDVDIVLGPAADGGYVLIAMKVAEPSLFDGVAWSTSRVLGQTREKLSALQLTHFELPVLNDVDRPEDLVFVEQRLPLHE